MSILIRKQKGLVYTSITRLAIIALIATFASALIDTIWAIYIDSFVNSMFYVGILSSCLTLLSFFSFFLFIPLIEKINKPRIYAFTLFFFGIAYILFAINSKFYIFVIISFILTIIQTFKITSWGIIIKDSSPKNNLVKNEGLMYTFANISWVIGPLIAGFVSDKYGISLIFILSSIFVFIAFFLFLISGVKDPNIKKRTDHHFFKNFIDFFKSKERIFAYLFGGGVSFWWTLIYLFMPIVIIRNGLHPSIIGYFLFAAALPTILFQYPFAKLAGKIGFKKIFRIGFFIPFFFALLCFFTGNIYLILVFLALASIGLAMLESTTEAYFFDILKGDKEELRFYGPYNTAIDVNHFIGRILSSAILFFLPFKFVFLFFSLAMFFFFLATFKAKNIIEEHRKK